MLRVALVGVTLTGCDPRLAHDDHAGRAAVDAEAAPRAHVLVDHEDHVVVGVDARLLGVRGLGHGVRVDSHAYSGYQIPPYYDSMIGKLICFGSTRKIALERSYRALSEYLIRGIKTTIPLQKAIMSDPTFMEGKATTAYMEEFFARTPTDLFIQ